MISSYQDYIDYFAGLATSHVDIKGFAKGSDAELMSELKDREDNPVLILETPDIRSEGSEDDLSERWSGAVEVVTSISADDYDEQHTALDAMLPIIRDIRNKIIYDAEDNDWEIDIRALPIVPVQSVLLDNYWGWRLDFTLQLDTGYCDQSKFQ